MRINMHCADILYTQSHLIFMKTLSENYCYFPFFTNKTEAPQVPVWGLISSK